MNGQLNGIAVAFSSVFVPLGSIHLSHVPFLFDTDEQAVQQLTIDINIRALI